jgi:hypothetical protein
MQPVQVLPPTYHPIGTLDITKDHRALLFLNLFGFLLLVLSGWFFLQAIIGLRRAEIADGIVRLEVSSLLDTILMVAGILLLTALYVGVHEAIHGFFFWLFTRSRPLFAFRWTYAYAAAPDWFLPRNQYLLTSLAPLIFITLGGLAVIPVVPASWLLGVWFVLTMNAGGSVGDLLVAGWLLRQPPTCLAQDRGDSVTLFNQAGTKP